MSAKKAFEVRVSNEDDDAVIRRNGGFLCRLPASELAELSDVLLEALCGDASRREAQTVFSPACMCIECQMLRARG